LNLEQLKVVKLQEKV